ncbi:hypothetical protein D3C77_568980 [compost metagenome]
MQLTMVVRLARQVTAVGFYLLQTVELRIITICPATHLQRTELPLQTDLSLIVRPASSHDALMAADPLLRGG